jgi:deazaflavin-dependent oxidoreductase (nitroreductase family)
VSLPQPHESRFWRRALPVEYALIGLLDPVIRRWWRAFGLGNVVELEVRGRRTGQPRRVLLGLLRDGQRWFLGHPNGDVAWTRNLEAAGEADLRFRGLPPLPVRAHRLPDGDLRNRAILATHQHPFPGNLIYRLARRHVLAAGTYFAIEPLEPR